MGTNFKEISTGFFVFMRCCSTISEIVFFKSIISLCRVNVFCLLTLYCNDLFQTMMITPKNHWAGQNLRCKYSCFRTVGLSFTYRFGGYKAKNHEAVDTSRMKK